MATVKTSKGARRLSAPKKTVKTKTRIIYREKECDKEHSDGSNRNFVLYAWECQEEVFYSPLETPISSKVYRIPYRQQMLELLLPESYEYDISSNTFTYSGLVFTRNPNYDLYF